MKKFISLAIASMAVSASAFGAPFLAIGDGAELFLTGKLAVRADDNIFLFKDATNDIIFDVTPGAELTFGKDAQLKGSLVAELAFSNYSDHSELNTQLFSSFFNSRYDDGKLKLGFNMSYAELNQNTPETRGLVRRDVFDAGANGEVEISQLTSIGAGLSYDRQDYHPSNYSDFKTLTIPVDFFYKFTPKVDLSVGYRYRENDVTIGQDSTDHYLNVGGRGEFSPKLTGRFSLGVTKRNYGNGGDETTFGLDGSFAYELSPKTSLQLGANNDFGTSPQGQEQKNFTINASIVNKLTEQWSINGGVSYRRIDYYSRVDDYFEGNLGAAYILNANIRLIGAYVYRNYNSDLATSEFTNNVFSIAANLRY